MGGGSTRWGGGVGGGSTRWGGGRGSKPMMKT